MGSCRDNACGAAGTVTVRVVLVVLANIYLVFSIHQILC